MPVVYVRTDTPLPERAKHDFYATDCLTVRRAIAALQRRVDRLPVPGLVLDPGAGTGIWGQEYLRFEPGACVVGVEIDPALPRPPYGYEYWRQSDFLTWDFPPGHYNLVIGNPPYNQAEAFVRKALELSKQHVYFLLKLSFLASQKRRDGLFREFPLRECLVLSKRPSFQQDLKTAPDEYAMFLWSKGWTGPATVSQL